MSTIKAQRMGFLGHIMGIPEELLKIYWTTLQEESKEEEDPEKDGGPKWRRILEGYNWKQDTQNKKLWKAKTDQASRNPNGG